MKAAGSNPNLLRLILGRFQDDELKDVHEMVLGNQGSGKSKEQLRMAITEVGDLGTLNKPCVPVALLRRAICEVIPSARKDMLESMKKADIVRWLGKDASADMKANPELRSTAANPEQPNPKKPKLLPAVDDDKKPVSATAHQISQCVVSAHLLACPPTGPPKRPPAQWPAGCPSPIARLTYSPPDL